MYAGGINGNTELEGSDMYVYADVSAAGRDSARGSAYAGGLAGTISRYNGGFSNAYVAGKVSAGGSADNRAGGIVGDIGIEANGSVAIDNCMVLLTALDGGSSPNVYVLGNENTNVSSGHITAWDEIAITRGGVTYTNDNTFSGLTLDPYKDISAFSPAEDYTNPDVVSDAYPGWNFNVGGDWKWISGYDLPVLSWQDTAPDLNYVPSGIVITWP
jgi:hypothetical protein